MRGIPPMKPILLLPLLALVLGACSSDEPKRKKVVGPDDGGISKLSWNRPRSWEGTARYGPMMPSSR
jgi:hypothetical protein